MNSHVSTLDSRPLPQAGEHLHCLCCEYDLTGLTGDICPECGTTVDWSGVREEAMRVGTPWETWRGRRKPLAFLLTTLEAALLPGRLARRLTPRPALRWPLVYLFICVGWQTGWYMYRVGLRNSIPYTAGALADVLAQTLLLTLLLPIRHVRYPWRFWLVVSCFTSYPLLIEAFGNGLPFILPDDLRQGRFLSNVWPLHGSGFLSPDLSVAASILFYLWWFDLVAIGWVRIRRRHRWRLGLLLIAVPLLTILASYGGFYAGGAAGAW